MPEMCQAVLRVNSFSLPKKKKSGVEIPKSLAAGVALSDHEKCCFSLPNMFCYCVNRFL